MKRCKGLTDIGIDKSLYTASILEANRLVLLGHQMFAKYLKNFTTTSKKIFSKKL